jgi:hypothetical protein
MKLHVLAGALALALGATALAPSAARADDRDDQYRSRSSRDYRSRAYREQGSRAYASRSFSRSYPRSYSHAYRAYPSYRSYAYRSYPSYYRDASYYGGYAPYAYRAPVVVAPAYGYGYGYGYYGYSGYRPLLGVSVGGPHFGVWLGF